MITVHVGDACNEERTEPDVNLILELCELVKSKTCQYATRAGQVMFATNATAVRSAHLAATALSEYFSKEDKVQTMIALFVDTLCWALLVSYHVLHA